MLRSDSFDAYLALYAEGSDEALAEDDDGLGEGTDARLRFTPEEDGTYVLRARTLSGTDGGGDSLSLRERPAPAGPGSTGRGFAGLALRSVPDTILGIQIILTSTPT